MSKQRMVHKTPGRDGLTRREKINQLQLRWLLCAAILSVAALLITLYFMVPVTATAWRLRGQEKAWQSARHNPLLPERAPLVVDESRTHPLVINGADADIKAREDGTGVVYLPFPTGNDRIRYAPGDDVYDLSVNKEKYTVTAGSRMIRHGDNPLWTTAQPFEDSGLLWMPEQFYRMTGQSFLKADRTTVFSGSLAQEVIRSLKKGQLSIRGDQAWTEISRWTGDRQVILGKYHRGPGTEISITSQGILVADSRQVHIFWEGEGAVNLQRLPGSKLSWSTDEAGVLETQGTLGRVLARSKQIDVSGQLQRMKPEGGLVLEKVMVSGLWTGLVFADSQPQTYVYFDAAEGWRQFEGRARMSPDGRAALRNLSGQNWEVFDVSTGRRVRYTGAEQAQWGDPRRLIVKKGTTQTLWDYLKDTRQKAPEGMDWITDSRGMLYGVKSQTLYEVKDLEVVAAGTLPPAAESLAGGPLRLLQDSSSVYGFSDGKFIRFGNYQFMTTPANRSQAIRRSPSDKYACWLNRAAYGTELVVLNQATMKLKTYRMGPIETQMGDLRWLSENLIQVRCNGWTAWLNADDGQTGYDECQ